jgi:ubiquitin-like 1-activating enzyme E1 B
VVAEVVPAKRSHPEGAEDAVAVKKAKTAASAADKDDGVINLDDSAGGAIVIDDD